MPDVCHIDQNNTFFKSIFYILLINSTLQKDILLQSFFLIIFTNMSGKASQSTSLRIQIYAFSYIRIVILYFRTNYMIILNSSTNKSNFSFPGFENVISQSKHKIQLWHLRPVAPNLFDLESIFQVFSNFKTHLLKKKSRN